MPKKFLSIRFLSIIVFLILIFGNYTILAEDNIDLFQETDEYDNLRVGNDYIAIVVNQDQNSHGRFAVETTGGDPGRDEDKDKPLIYGRPKPWASYTTFLIDGNRYVFGGETGRRAGRNGNYGQVIEEVKVENNEIKTVCEMDGIRVEQLLSIVKSSTTGLYDSVLIEYKITNTTSEKKNIGTRIMLDTQLGENDGAPFRIGGEEISTDTLLLPEELPEFWQAFDSIRDPQVISQGTFRTEGITTPDRVYLSDWGSLADGVWDFDFNPGEKFKRKGEPYALDSAIALFWDPQDLAPEETRTYSTKYGLGGITMVPGMLTVGASSPAEVTFEDLNDSFPVVSYIENTSEITAKNVEVEIKLPDHFEVENYKYQLGDLESGEITQVNWQVENIIRDLPQKSQYQIYVDAENTDSNQLLREFNIISPAQIELDIKASELKVEDKKLTPDPFKITANIKNIGGTTLYFPEVRIDLATGLQLVSQEKRKKNIVLIKPGEELNISWNIKSSPQIYGYEKPLEYLVSISGKDGYFKEKKEELSIPEVPELTPVIYLTSRSSDEYKNKYITLNFKGENIADIENMEISMEYNSEYLQLLNILPGNVFVKEDNITSWNEPEINDNVINIKQSLPDKDDFSNHLSNLAYIVFEKIKEIPEESKESPVDIQQLIFKNEKGEEIETEFEILTDN